MKLILDAPVDFVAQVLGSWLTFKDLCNLDSAVCSTDHRISMGAIYEALSMESRFIKDSLKIEKQLDWLLVRKIRLFSLQYIHELPKNTFSKVAALLKHSGNHVRKLRVVGNDSMLNAVGTTIVQYCTKLEALEIELTPQLFALCGRLNGLKELKIALRRSTSLKGVHRIVFCRSVSALVLNGNFPVKLQRNLLIMCPNLITYSLSDCYDVGLQDLPEDLVSVQVIDCTRCIGDVHLNANLKKLRISCIGIRDETMVEILNSCSNLQELSLSGNMNITDGAIEKIGDVCGRSLTSLDLFGCECISKCALKYVCEKCINLVHLSIGGGANTNPSFITTALNALPLLRSLTISDASVSDALFAKIAVAESLEALDIRDVSGCTEKGILSLVNGCGSLKLIAITNALVTPLVRLMWHGLRPELRIEESVE